MSAMENLLIKSNYEKIEHYLKQLIRNIPEINAAAIISDEGLPVVSVLPSGLDENRVAALTAIISTISIKSIREMRLGSFRDAHIKGKEGYLFIFSVGKNAVLYVSTTKEISHRFGLILLECSQICEKISKI